MDFNKYDTPRKEPGMPYLDWMALRQKVKDRFWSDAFTSLGIPDTLTEPQSKLLKTTAWDLGHAQGLRGVYSCLSDLWEMISLFT